MEVRLHPHRTVFSHVFYQMTLLLIQHSYNELWTGVMCSTFSILKLTSHRGRASLRFKGHSMTGMDGLWMSPHSTDYEVIGDT